MPRPKPVGGRSEGMARAGSCFMSQRDEGGASSGRAACAPASDAAGRSALDHGKRWRDVMDEARERFGDDESHGQRAARAYGHFMIPPDPRDDIAPEGFRDFRRRWAIGLLDDTENGGRRRVAIICRERSGARIDDGAEGIPRPRVIVAGVELEGDGGIAEGRANGFAGDASDPRAARRRTASSAVSPSMTVLRHPRRSLRAEPADVAARGACRPAQSRRTRRRAPSGGRRRVAARRSSPHRMASQPPRTCRSTLRAGRSRASRDHAAEAR